MWLIWDVFILWGKMWLIWDVFILWGQNVVDMGRVYFNICCA
jgi:hypothetical protein